VDANVIEQLIFRGGLKFYDPRVTEKALTRFWARYGALIKSDFSMRRHGIGLLAQWILRQVRARTKLAG
jgi:hypothetical protein